MFHTVMAYHILLSLAMFALLMIPSLVSPTTFSYPAVFNFGDSNSDSGGLVAGMGEQLDPPNGQTFFKKPSGRFCDGRLIIDFLSKYIILPCTLSQTMSHYTQLCTRSYISDGFYPYFSGFLSVAPTLCSKSEECSFCSGCHGSSLVEPLLGGSWVTEFQKRVQLCCSRIHHYSGNCLLCLPILLQYPGCPVQPIQGSSSRSDR